MKAYQKKSFHKDRVLRMSIAIEKSTNIKKKVFTVMPHLQGYVPRNAPLEMCCYGSIIDFTYTNLDGKS